MECEQCGTEFAPRHKRHKKCCGRGTKNATRARRSAVQPARFVGVDGEGVTLPDGIHRYVLLSVGTESLTNGGEHLTWGEVFRFIYEHNTRNPDSVYVGFYLGYDFTQWLRTLPAERAARLLTIPGQASRVRRTSGGNPVPFAVDARDHTDTRWQFDILAAKRIKFRPAGSKRWTYVCDAGGFFQSSFLMAIDPKTWTEPVASAEEYALIVAGKRERATAVLNSAMIRYNITENTVLARLMTRLDRGLRQSGLKLHDNQWFGPGQVAAAWLKSVDAPTVDDIAAHVPEWATDAGQAAYYGGWFEIMAHGHIPGEVHEYDINSAYPHVISTLPCLLHGEWARGSGEYRHDPSVIRMVRATVESRSDRTGAVPYRSPTGRIYRPRLVTGWYWEHELRSATSAGLVHSVIPHEWVTYRPCDCPPPLREISNLYQRRLQVGKNSPEGRALKLVYNSAYGKFAQTVGNPRYSNSIYASLITAGCRTAILRAIATHPTKAESLVMVATDGVYFREPHTRLPLDAKRLGGWDHSVKHNLTLVMPGIYWDDNTRESLAEGGAPRLKSRGISAADLGSAVEKLDHEWNRFSACHLQDWPTLRVSVRFSMVSAKQASVRGRWETAGTIATDGDRLLNSDPTLKRFGVYREHGIIRSGTHWFTYDGPQESSPYSKKFGASEYGREDVPITPDADDVDQLWGWALL